MVARKFRLLNYCELAWPITLNHLEFFKQYCNQYHFNLGKILFPGKAFSNNPHESCFE